jgi:alcohol dehydrogenase
MVDREIRDPGFGEVLVTVEARGVCLSDAAFVNNALPGASNASATACVSGR